MGTKTETTLFKQHMAQPERMSFASFWLLNPERILTIVLDLNLEETIQRFQKNKEKCVLLTIVYYVAQEGDFLGLAALHPIYIPPWVC